MKIGIKNIGSFLPEKKISNYDLKNKFDIDDNFIENKIGIKRVARKENNMDTSDLCVKAFDDLLLKESIDLDKIDVLIVVTQNPDFNIPHTSAIVQGKLNISENCACFDVSLGCSGFVYALSIVESFMKLNNFENGLIFTADPYSKILDSEDKNTSLLFGDAAAVTYISKNPVYTSGKFTFGTIGKKHEELICRDGKLAMNGRGIFNFAAKNIPKDVKKVLELNDEKLENIDKFLFHQGSKFLVDTLIKRVSLDRIKVPFLVSEYGNTVSSSIPFLLQNEMESNSSDSTILISGFGVGLSWSSTILYK